MPGRLPPPSPMALIGQDAKEAKAARRTGAAGAILGAKAAEGYYQQQKTMPPPPPAMTAYDQPGGALGGLPGGLPGAPPMGGMPGGAIAAAQPGLPPMGMASQPGSPPPGIPPLGQAGVPQGPPPAMALGGRIPAYVGGGMPLGPGAMPQMAPPPPSDRMPPQGGNLSAMPPGIVGSDSLFSMAKNAMDAAGSTGITQPNAGLPTGGPGIGQEPDSGPAPAAFIAWLSGPAAQTGQLGQDLAQLYAKDPTSADDLWAVVIELVNSGDPEIPPEVADLVASADQPAGNMPPAAAGRTFDRAGSTPPGGAGPTMAG